MTWTTRSVLLSTIVAAGVAVATPTLANNTTNHEPGYLPPNGAHRVDTVTGTGGGSPERWYVATLKGGRSYCSDLFPTSASTGVTGLARQEFFQSDGTTPFAGWVNNFTQNPQSGMFATGPITGGNAGANRYCISFTGVADNSDQIVFIRINNTDLGATALSASYSLALLDTTVYCPWYFTDASYEAFAWVQNVTSSAVTFTVTWYSAVLESGGATSALGSTTFTLPGFGTTLVGAKSTSGIPAGSLGGLKILSTAAPGALKANVATVNITGIGLTAAFNTPCGTQYELHPLAE